MRLLFLILLLPVFSYTQGILSKKKLHRHAWVSPQPPPPQPLSASVTDHRYDAVMTFTQCTDIRVATSVWAMEMFGFRHNIRLGIFNYQAGYNTGSAEADSTGLVRQDIYFQGSFWADPADDFPRNIPDYNLAAWSTAGEAVFANAESGQSKTARYPNHGQEMYDVSNGAFGFDFNTNTVGSNGLDEFTILARGQQSWFIGLHGRYAAAGAYQNGKDNSRVMQMPYFLALRNTSPGNAGVEVLPFTITDPAHTTYGDSKDGNGRLGYPDSVAFTREYWVSYPSSTRWYDLFHSTSFTQEQSTTYFLDNIDSAIAHRGWFRDFTHWHSARTSNELDDLSDLLDSARDRFGGHFVWTCGSGEAIEYMFARECADTVIAFEQGDSVIIDVVYEDPFAGGSVNTFPTDIRDSCLNTPLTIRVNLSSTALAGKLVQASYGKVVSKGSDIWLVEVPFNHQTHQFDSVSLKEAQDDGNIYDTDVPVIVSADVVSNTLTVTTDIPTRAALFSAATSGADIDFVNNARSNTLSTTHVFTLTEGNDYYVGVISEFKQATLSTKISH